MADYDTAATTPEAEFIGDLIAWTESLPLAWAHGSTMLFLLALLLACWMMPRDHVLADAAPGRWRDLRIWASVLILLQLGLYQLFS